jgi:hypothetical protein
MLSGTEGSRVIAHIVIHSQASANTRTKRDALHKLTSCKSKRKYGGRNTSSYLTKCVF